MTTLNGQKEGAEWVVAYYMILFDKRFGDLGDIGSDKRQKKADELKDKLPEWAQ